jgi:hypothetical protein
MQSQEADLAGCWRPVDQDQRKRLSTVRMVEFVREYDISGRVLR